MPRNSRTRFHGFNVMVSPRSSPLSYGVSRVAVVFFARCMVIGALPEARRLVSAIRRQAHLRTAAPPKPEVSVLRPRRPESEESEVPQVNHSVPPKFSPRRFQSLEFFLTLLDL